ncbi:MAG: HAMP domain-containing protein [Mariprofundaceae bacterium]|nr:HAMP domain-containing protein [Mariprofundaceae bacterium]
MPRIFWKVFLWFWLTLSLTVIASFWLGGLWSERDGNSVQLAHLQSLAASAESILEERGEEALRPWMRHVRHRTPLRILIIDSATGESLRGREIPAHLKVHLQPPEKEDGIIESKFEDRQVISLPIAGPDGHLYRLIGESRPHHTTTEREIRFFKHFAEERMLIALTVTVLVCLLVAYWLVRPIRQMQQTARRFGEGDFSVRSGLERRKDEIGDLAREFDAMAERIDSMLQSQQRLLRDVSHELRSPLARLQVALELARKRSGSDTKTELDRIGHEADQVDTMIGDMLTLVRLESGEEQVEESFDLSVLIESVISDANYEFSGQNKQVRLVTTVPVIMLGSAHLIRSAIENVVRNGMKYTPADTMVDICMKAEAEDQIEIKICDCGEGVPDESLSRLFDPFYRVGEARDRQGGGFGLGLSIAARVIRSHGGSVHAQNREGGGLQVTITLPASVENKKQV